MRSVTVDLTLAHSSGSNYTADLRVTIAGSPAPISPLPAPAPVALDLALLRALTLDPHAYGQALSTMLFADPTLRGAFAQARAVAAQQGAALRLCLSIQPEAAQLHTLRWECIMTPAASDQHLASGGLVLLSRTLPSSDWTPLGKPSSAPLRAVALIAAPRDLPDYGLTPINAALEIAHIRTQLGNCNLTVLGDGTPATLPALLQQLHAGCDLLFILAHGRADDQDNLWLYLEDKASETAPTPDSALVHRIIELADKPRLVILAVCESAGNGSSATLAGLGPQLVQVGVPAVLAMQGRISHETLTQFLPACLQTLQQDGRIDRAVGVARSLIADRPDWWVPTLWMRPGDGALWTTPSTPVPAAQALHQLRAPVPDFVGRGVVVEKLVAALRTGTGGCATISGVRGMGGLGKTELAHAVAAQLQNDYPDAQLLLELRGASDTPLSPTQVLQQVIRIFRPEDKLPEELPALQAIYRSVLSGRRALLLADDAKDAAQVRPLLPPSGCALLVTSRQRFVLDGMTVLDLSRLDTAAAVALLRGICSRLTEEQARRIADFCAGLPLALRVSAGILLNDEALSVDRYLSRLADERQRLTSLRDPDDPTRDVKATLLQSYAALDDHARASFRRLGVLAADADLALVGAVLGLPEDQAESVMHGLLRRSLVEYDRTHERWGMHDLVRSCALELLNQAAEEHAARRHYAEHVTAVIQQADRRYQSGGEGVLEGLTVFDRERVHLETIRTWLWAQPPTGAIDTLLIAEADATANLGILRDPLQRVRVAQLERAQAAARRQGDRPAEGRFVSSLGDVYRELGEIQRATSSYERALAIARELGDRHGEGQALGNLGNACLSQGQLRQALDLYQQHLAIAQALGDRLGEGRALGNLGNTYWALGEVPRAVGYLEQWVTIARELGDRQREGKALGNLGSAFHVLGEIQRAIDCYQQHLAIARELGDRQQQGRALGNLGEAHADLGDLTQAVDSYNQALLLLHDMGDRCNEAYILNQSGCARLRQGRLDEALAQSSAALALTRTTGERRLEGVSLLTIAEIHAAARRTAEADACYTESLAILEAIGCEGEAARARWIYGQFLVTEGAYKRGLSLMEACIAYEQQIGHSQADKHASILAHIQQKITTTAL